jgi:hypothetical protein
MANQACNRESSAGGTGALTERHAPFFVRAPVHPAGFPAHRCLMAIATTVAAASESIPSMLRTGDAPRPLLLPIA